jgi:uncharacterized membrane protein
MNEAERSELELLKQRQESLGRQLAFLAKEIEALESRVSRTKAEPVAPATPAEQQAVPAAKPPGAVPQTSAAEKLLVTRQPHRQAQAPAVPPIIPVAPATAPTPAGTALPPGTGAEKNAAAQIKPPPAASAAAVPTTSAPPPISPAAGPAAPPGPAATSTVPPSPPAKPPSPATAAPAPAPTPRPKEKSFELRLGTFWLPLIGIVLLVTGLVFFGNYAYQNFVVRMNAAGKVSLLYLASFTLLGLGSWWQRRTVNESLRNYGQVLFAGGLAMVYFTTYAAHHFNHLRVIPSALWDGALLLGWAAYMVWIADRRKSQVLALFAVLLAYYTAVITHVGQFTLYSNLVLTLAALFFMVRNRWAVLSFTSLAASYAAYGYWRFFNGHGWHWASVEEGLWTGTYFLIAYWIVFTAAVFLSRDEKFAGANRSSFLTLNNGAFFTMFLLTMYQVHHGGFWKFALAYGITLIALAELSRLTLRGEPAAANSYLTQGLLLGTIGLISHPRLGGLNLALVLAAESVTLLLAGQQRRNVVMLAGAYICAALAVGWGMDGMLLHESRGLWLGVGLGAIMLGNTLLAHREHQPATQTLLRPQPSYFALLALAIWWAATYDNASRAGLPVVLAFEGVLFIASIYLLRIRELSVFGLLYLGLAQALWFYDVLHYDQPVTWWHAVSMIVLAIGTTEWCRRQRVLPQTGEASVRELALLSLVLKNVVLLGAGMVAFRIAGGWQEVRFASLSWKTGVVPIGLGALMLADGLIAARRGEVKENTLKGGHRAASGVPEVSEPTAKDILKSGHRATPGISEDSEGAREATLKSEPQTKTDILKDEQQTGAFSAPALRWQPAYSFILALGVWLAVTWHHTTPESFPLVLSAEGLVLTFSYYLLRVPELSLLSQGYVLLAQLAWLFAAIQGALMPSWWSPVLLIAMTLGLSHWWQKQKVLVLPREASLFWQCLNAAAIVAVIFFWLNPQVSPVRWLVLSSALAIGVTAYGVVTRAWFLAAFGQFFALVSAGQFIMQLGQGKPHWLTPLAPVAVLGLLSWSTWQWFQRKPDPTQRISSPLLQIAQLYRWVGLLMSLWWAGKYIPDQEQVWFLMALSLAIFIWSGWRGKREGMLFAAAYAVTAVALFWTPFREIDRVYLPNFLALLALLAAQRIAKGFSQSGGVGPRIQGAMIIMGGLSLWLFVYDWVTELTRESGNQSSYLTASYSALGLIFFIAGMILRERVYRWLGLSILAFCLARVMVIDVWKLTLPFKVLSFMALGIVLLVLGFIYNKHQEKIKEWL